MIERANADFEGSRKEFWAFVSRRSKGKKRKISSLKNEGRVSVTSTRGKLQSHYERLGKVSEGSDFDDDWKEEVAYFQCRNERCWRWSGNRQTHTQDNNRYPPAHACQGLILGECLTLLASGSDPTCCVGCVAGKG